MKQERTMPTKIETFLTSLSNLDQAKSLVTETARFIAVREQSYPDLPLYGTFIGHTGLEQFALGLREAYDTQQFQIDHILENEVMGAAFGQFEHRIRATDEFFRSHWALLCEFDGAKISMYRFYEDTAALEEAIQVRTVCKERLV